MFKKKLNYSISHKYTNLKLLYIVLNVYCIVNFVYFMHTVHMIVDNTMDVM